MRLDLVLLRKVLESEKLDEAERLLEEIGRYELKQAIPLLVEFLKSTENKVLRNSIAITLSDIGSEEVVEPLIEMINDPRTLGARGTLLYALEPFDCSAHIETLVYHLITGNIEVQHHSNQLIEAIQGKISDEVILNCIMKVKNALYEIERQQELLSDVLEKLFSLKKI